MTVTAMAIAADTAVATSFQTQSVSLQPPSEPSSATSSHTSGPPVEPSVQAVLGPVKRQPVKQNPIQQNSTQQRNNTAFLLDRLSPTDQAPPRTENNAPEDEQDETTEGEESADPVEPDDELGILRLQERPVGADIDLGVLRIREIDGLPPEPIPARPRSIFVTARAGAFGNTNLFRAPEPEGEQVYRVGVGLYAFPELTEGTTLIAGVEGNFVRYGQLNQVNYNELQLQAGLRQRLSERTFGQISWRNQRLYVPGGEEFFSSNFIELLLSRRDILSDNTWLDSYYQARVSFSEPETFSRFSQSAIASLNYGFTREFRATLVYQLFLDDYTQIERYDTYHQILGQLTYDLSPSSRVNLFTGYRFGRSSLPTVNFDDFVYGVSYSLSLPLF